MPALEFRDVEHFYGATPAIKKISLAINPGEVVCLLGPSGCGKTTALRLAAGLEEPERGTVWIKGNKVAGEGAMIAPEHRNVGLVFQDYALFPHLKIGENIAFGIRDLSNGAREERISSVLEQVGMQDYAEAYPHMLSGGQQQRVALARALASDPTLILMDEPFSGLDARLRDAVRDRTLHVLKKTGTATLMVTHDAEEAMYMADRIVVMRDGLIMQTGTPEELYNAPNSAFVAEFFGEVNRIEKTVQNGRIDTPVGQFDANGFAEGSDVEVIIRPEAFRLQETNGVSPGPGQAKILASKLLGRSSLIHMCSCETTGEEWHIHARVAGRYLPPEGAFVSLELDKSQAFVFPR
ncbi:iron(III) transport system ATP-binding protein [Aestuariispira insulae]|uniref:Iron(III) transport system ATP-binding protein n=2 Tax=Aestuariispira insulae TaxID=1461337 RepID=A0A3D9HQ43_9PROT|nr:iron(III) transport system ATP-binding protein [Aestuariispira insulae]